MGRGRQKAKQTKVARELKYFSPDTDYDALRRELGATESPPTPSVRPDAAETDDDDQDEFADWSAEGRR